MMFVNQIEFTVCQHYAAALVTDDWTGLEEEDVKILEAFIENNHYEFCITDDEPEPYFAYCDVCGLRGDVIDIVGLVYN